MTIPPPDQQPAAETRTKHQCPDCKTDCHCLRGTLNPKDCIHMECISGVHDEECDLPSAETLKQVAERYVADLPPSTDCAFNVAKKGQHRFCSRMGRRCVGGYYFCRQHADVVAMAVFESIKKSQSQPNGPSGKESNL